MQVSNPFKRRSFVLGLCSLNFALDLTSLLSAHVFFPSGTSLSTRCWHARVESQHRTVSICIGTRHMQYLFNRIFQKCLASSPTLTCSRIQEVKTLQDLPLRKNKHMLVSPHNKVTDARTREAAVADVPRLRNCPQGTPGQGAGGRTDEGSQGIVVDRLFGCSEERVQASRLETRSKAPPELCVSLRHRRRKPAATPLPGTGRGKEPREFLGRGRRRGAPANRPRTDGAPQRQGTRQARIACLPKSSAKNATKPRQCSHPRVQPRPMRGPSGRFRFPWACVLGDALRPGGPRPEQRRPACKAEARIRLILDSHVHGSRAQRRVT
jgi:hypothetical protein